MLFIYPVKYLNISQPTGCHEEPEDETIQINWWVILSVSSWLEIFNT